MVKSEIKFPLLGGVVGAMLMLAVVIISWQVDKPQSLDTQVIQYLESAGYTVESLGKSRYGFYVDGDRYIFEYFPDDQTYLRIFTVFDVGAYSRDDMAAACFKVMKTKKNSIIIKNETSQGLTLHICCESFVSMDNAVEPYIIDHSICVIQESKMQIVRILNHCD